MAKKSKGARQQFALICTVCKSHNYTTEKNKTNTQDKLELVKYCKRCRKRTAHKESAKLK
jgi:large subunit ribosomal protein L33